ncbi:calcium uptake protein 1, mitochondrial-like isoform X2 [Anneissia japonica]|uniref:calcium uptake protein 1, mitochondrial-like isoform X2 n=1 Tax=Anneissia japonica TaxID=1529436 RepID=UPI001425B963|nr:calcium uptake protein 1, mitochondrial-like isoform X2 [Anneissia japonica]
MFARAVRQGICVLTQVPRYGRRCITQYNQELPNRGRLLYYLIGGGTGIVTGSIAIRRSLHASVDTTVKTSDEAKTDEELSETEDESEEGEVKEKGKKRTGFRDRKIIEYENRIRHYSTPDKIFRYFATIKMVDEQGDSEIYMTPEDFIRSITPDEKQPEGLGLDQFIKVTPKTFKQKHFSLKEDSLFFHLGECGLISFVDYMFLLTVLSTPSKHFEIAFRLFDLNGDGVVSSEEFSKVTDVIRAQTATGKRHRDRSTTGNTLDKHPTASSLSTYFFGPNLDRKLTTADFAKFHKELKLELLRMEFERCNPVDGRISEQDVAHMLLVYANITRKREIKMMKRVKKKYRDDPKGITLTDYLNLHEMLRNISDIDLALSFYHVAGASVDKATFKHVAKMVANVDLSDHLTDVVFTLFDEDDDDKLSHHEFVSVMKHRVMRGLDKPKEVGLAKITNSMWKCAKKTKILKDSHS